MYKKIDINLATHNINMPEEVFNNTVIVLENQSLSKERIVELHRSWGFTPKKTLPNKTVARLWFEDKKYYDLMYDTNYIKKETEGRSGLFGKGNLDWHLDGPTHPDPEDIISLYCVIPTSAKTHYINGVLAYEALDSSTKSYIEDINLVLGYNSEYYQNVNLPWFIRCNYNPECLSYDLNSEYIEDDVKELMAFTYIDRESVKPSVDSITKIGQQFYEESGKYKAVFRPLTITNTLGKPGLFFPPGAIIGFTGIPESEWRELYTFLWEHLKKWSFTRNWKVGDLVLWDNLMVNHKRDDLVVGEKRELWRFAIYV